MHRPALIARRPSPGAIDPTSGCAAVPSAERQRARPFRRPRSADRRMVRSAGLDQIGGVVIDTAGSTRSPQSKGVHHARLQLHFLLSLLSFLSFLSLSPSSSATSSPATSSSVSGPGSAAPRRRRGAVGAVVAVAVLAAPAGLSSSAAATASAVSSTSGTVVDGDNAAGPGRVRGRARVFYRYSPHDDIRFSVGATAAPFSRPVNGLPHGMPTDARGMVTISHWSPGKKQGRRAEASVDCLVTGGDTATLSAVVTKSEDPGRSGSGWASASRTAVPAREGSDSPGPSRTSMSSMATPPSRSRYLYAPAPFASVVQGGFKVTHAELPPLPAEWAERAGGSR